MQALAYVHAYVGHGHGAGAETTLHDLLSHLVRLGWDATVQISRDDRGIEEPYEVDGVRVLPHTARDDVNRLAPSADVLFTHLDTTERTVYLGKIEKKPVVQVIHNELPPTLGYVDLGCDLAVYNTHWVRQTIEDNKDPVIMLGVENAINYVVRQHYDPPRGVVVHPAVSRGQYLAEKHGNAVTLVNMWPGDRVRCGKGTDIFYNLATANSDVPFIAVKGGYGKNQDIRDLPNVTVIENTTDMRSVYEQTMVLLMPSIYESFGRVALEAAYSGIPTIASPTPGLRENLGPGGLYVERENISGWDRALRKLLGEPGYYNDLSWYHRDRADYWESERTAELASFSLALEMMLGEFHELHSA